jgi:hypothetical protein
LGKSVTAIEELQTYLRGIIARRRAEPRDDLLSALVKAQEKGDRLSDDELLANSILLLNAAHETTTNVSGNGTLALLRHPDQLGRLRDAPSLIPSAVEEVLRYDSPAQFTSRIVKAHMEVGGKVMRVGQVAADGAGPRGQTLQPTAATRIGAPPNWRMGNTLAALESWPGDGSVTSGGAEEVEDLRLCGCYTHRLSHHINQDLLGHQVGRAGRPKIPDPAPGPS